ncbi:MAG: hypothetical protein OEW21_14030 [Betaproteobacteria bacterium]|nr:hypothetical protein [Betaproteobacteria bacterium]
MLCAVLLAPSVAGLAANPPGKGAVPGLGNAGFEKNPPAALKQKFAMCDAFLKVRWINETKQIGHSEFEAPLEDRNGKFLGRGNVSVLVMMKDDPAPEMRYEISHYKKHGRLEALFDALRNAELTGAWGGTGWNISHRGENFHIDFNAGPEDASFAPVLSDYRQTVCVVYPDGRRAWISEGRLPSKLYGKARFDALLRDLKSAGAGVESWQLAQSWILDVNGDGIPDYVNFRSESPFTYSLAKHYYTARLVEGSGPSPTGAPTDRIPTYSFPPHHRSCAVEFPFKYLTTDGRRYFINNHCDLTDLTTPAGAK